MGRKSIPIIDNQKQCRGKHGCGEWKPLDQFQMQQDIYYMSHCKSCEKKRQKGYRRAA